MQSKEGETAAFSWILYESREQRGAVNAKVTTEKGAPPFNAKRMFFGGFATIVKLARP